MLEKVFIIFSLLVQHEIIMVKKQHALSFDTRALISTYGYENSLNHLATPDRWSRACWGWKRNMK